MIEHEDDDSYDEIETGDGLPIPLGGVFSLDCAISPGDKVGLIPVSAPDDGRPYAIIEIVQHYEDPCGAISQLVHGGHIATKVFLTPAGARRLVAGLMNALDMMGDGAPNLFTFGGDPDDA